MRVFIFFVFFLSGFIGWDYYKYTKLPLRKVHIEYAIYSLSGKHEYTRDLDIKGEEIYIIHSGTTTSPYESIQGSGCFFGWWGNQTFRLRTGVNQELEVYKFYYKR